MKRRTNLTIEEEIIKWAISHFEENGQSVSWWFNKELTRLSASIAMSGSAR